MTQQEAQKSLFPQGCEVVSAHNKFAPRYLVIGWSDDGQVCAYNPGSPFPPLFFASEDLRRIN